MMGPSGYGKRAMSDTQLPRKASLKACRGKDAAYSQQDGKTLWTFTVSWYWHLTFIASRGQC